MKRTGVRGGRSTIGSALMWLLSLALPGGPLPAQAESEIFVATGSGVLVFPRTASGNVAPSRMLPGNGSGGVFVDTLNNEVFVSVQGAIQVYARGGNGFGVAPIRTIEGPATEVNGPFGIFVDTVHNELWVAETADNKVLVFSRTANGNVAPIRKIENQSVNDSGYFDQLTVVVDLIHDEALVTATKLNADVILVFPRLANGTSVLPLREISGGLNAALEGMFLNTATDEIIVASAGKTEIRVYPRTASSSPPDSPTPLPPTRVIKGPTTGLGEPVGLDVDLAAGEIIVSDLNSSSVRVFPLSGNGDIAPLRVITGPATRMESNLQLMILGPIPGPLPSPLVASVLPVSRSVKTGTAATAFATMINTGPPLDNCELAPLNGPPSTPLAYTFQTTDPATNQVVGAVNAPVTIPGNSAQTFVFAFTPTFAFSPIDVQLAFQCAGSALAPVISGLDTILLSASATPVPDLIALVATIGNNGILDLTAVAGVGTVSTVTATGAFSVASANVGAAGMITVTPDVNGAALPLTLTICQTDPQTGICTSGTPGPSVTTQIDAGQTPTFAVFGLAQGSIPFDPANNRVFVRYKDQNGVVRGATSVAVRTP